VSNHDPVAGTPPDLKGRTRGGLYVRIAATGAVFALSALSASRIASASFDGAAFPIGDVATLDGIVSGTVRIAGDRFSFFSGDRFQSNTQNLAVNFTSGGSLVLCPHSQVQVIAANQNSGSQNTGMMLAFEQGGSEQPFPVHTGDVVMTPDWRIEMQGNVHPGDSGVLELSTSRSGVLCLSSNVNNGEYLRVSQLVGDSVYEIAGRSSIKIAGGRIENSPEGCACESAPARAAVQMPGLPAGAPIVASATASSPAISSPAPQPNPAPAANSNLAPKKNERPQDVAGYMRSFVHLIFGR
jgi:hypothetical protein